MNHILKLTGCADDRECTAAREDSTIVRISLQNWKLAIE